MNSPLLSEADFTRLESIYNLTSAPPRPSHEQRLALSGYLALAASTTDAAKLDLRIGFGDEVVLISPSDPTDDFRLCIVMPHEADPAEGRVSILAPVSLAILGQEKGSLISWDANGGTRQMHIAEINKQNESNLAPLSS